MASLRLTKSAQIWGMDLVVGVIIFSVSLGIFYIFTLNDSGLSSEKVESLSNVGKIISNSILSEGSPVNWDSSNVLEIGIFSDGKINETKLESFYNLAVVDYPRTKIMFNSGYDYYFFLDDSMNISSKVVDGIGKPGVNRDNISSENLIKISRIVPYKGKLTNARIYVWGK